MSQQKPHEQIQPPAAGPLTAPPGTSHPPSPPASPDFSGRRRLLRWFALSLGTIASIAFAIPVVGYILAALIKKDGDVWLTLGPIDKFPERETRLTPYTLPHAPPWDGDSKHASAYVRRLEGLKFQVIAVNCAHLGCPVSWFPAAGLFLCPCHGGVYYEDGSYASGPPPRGLYMYEHRFVLPGSSDPLSAEQLAKLSAKDLKRVELQIKGGHLPTLQDTLGGSRQGTKI